MTKTPRLLHRSNNPPNGLLTTLIGLRAAGKRTYALLVDPDKVPPGHLNRLVQAARQLDAAFWLVGGSLITHPDDGALLRQLRTLTQLPVILFPAGVSQLSSAADGVLLLSLISGRNPELLIGEHVRAAPVLHQLALEVIPTGYMLVDGGRPTTASYMSGTLPLPADKPELAAYTALAGEYLGLRLLYVDAGSGAAKPVSPAMIEAITNLVSLPLLVGGGIRTAAQAEAAFTAGADVVVVGTALEQPEWDTNLLQELAATAAACSTAAALTH